MSSFIRRFVIRSLCFSEFALLTAIQWSGAEYVDALLMTVSGGVSSTAAMGKGVTEDQFKQINEKAKSKL